MKDSTNAKGMFYFNSQKRHVLASADMSNMVEFFCFVYTLYLENITWIYVYSK